MSQPLRLNLSDDEASSEVRSYEVLPSGEYLCNIVEVEEKVVQPGKKNSGKPFFKMRLVVDEGKYAGKPVFTNVMLFEGALYTATQLIRATFPDFIQGNQIDIPPADKFEGKQVVAVVQKFSAGSKRKDGTIRDQDESPIRGFKPANAVRKTGDSSLLPEVLY